MMARKRPWWMPDPAEERAKARAAAAEHRRTAVCGVFRYDPSDPSRGYVAREGWIGADGSNHWSSPYNDGRRCIKAYRSMSAAEKHAYKLTFGGG